MDALFIGRFQPLHKGHLSSIKNIALKADRVFLVIGSSQESGTQDNPFTFSERKEMLKRSLSSLKNCHIYGMPDVFDNLSWARTILKITKLDPSKTTVFTGNPWTKECFDGIKVRTLPHPSFLNKLSSSQIRARIRKGKEWENLMPRQTRLFLRTINGEERIKLSGMSWEKRIISFIKEKAPGGVVGISGGIDSALTAYLAHKAFGSKTIFLYLPTTAGKTPKNILLLEKKLGIKIKTISLAKIYQSSLRTLPRADKMAQGNLQSRLRMAVLYYFANLHNFLVIGTTNRSEMEIGYFTKYGDGGVDIEPIADLYKTEVATLAEKVGLPSEIIQAVPAAGFWVGQNDEEEIGLSYQNLDIVLKLFSQGLKVKEIAVLTNISLKRISAIKKRKEDNLHKLSLPAVCSLRTFVIR